MTKTTWYDNMTEEQKAALDREFNDRWKKLNAKRKYDWYHRMDKEERAGYNRKNYEKYKKHRHTGNSKDKIPSEKYLTTRAWLVKKYPQYFKDE